MNRPNFVSWIVYGTSFIILAFVALVFYWLVIDRSPPTNVKGGEVIYYERQPNGSWLIIIRWHGERIRSCWGNSKRWITDRTPHSLGLVMPLDDIAYPPDYPANQKVGLAVPFEWEVPVMVPAYFATSGHIRGAYKIRILYACNPLQEYLFPIVVEPPAVPFELPEKAP